MKISVDISHEVPTRPHDQFSAKKEVALTKVVDMEAEPEIVAAMLRGIANKIDAPKSQSYTHTGLTNSLGTGGNWMNANG